MLARIITSRCRVWLAARLLNTAQRLRRLGIAILESEERRWGLSPVDNSSE